MFLLYKGRYTIMGLQESLESLSSSFNELVLALSDLRVLFVLIIIIFFIVRKKIKKNKKYNEYKNSAYYQVTKTPYIAIKHDKGKYGEYLTYKYLKSFEESGARFLFNLYIPKKDGKTTEIDILMICSKGVFVFESKNFSGWIFGDECQKDWYQTLPKGRGKSQKEHFHNPIMQNNAHIKHLKAFLGEKIPMRSIIVFSERCTLKDIKIRSSEIHVINRYDVVGIVNDIFNHTPDELLSENEIAVLYNKLYPYTQVDSAIKQNHIQNTQNDRNTYSIPQITIPADTSLPSENEEQSQEEEVKTLSIEMIEKREEDTEKSQDNIFKSDPTNREDKEFQIRKCPNCGGDLILRIATRGAKIGNQFYGCSNYPKCKYIQNIETTATTE